MNKAKNCFEKFCERMAAGDLKKAMDLTQKTWKTTAAEPEKVLEMIRERLNWNLIRYRAAKEVGKAAVDIKFDSMGYTYLLRMVCEKEAYKPSTSGSWGVNPISLRRRENDKFRHAVN